MADLHPRVSWVNAVNGEGTARCYPDAATAWGAAVTEQPYNNTRLAASWCPGPGTDAGTGCTLADPAAGKASPR